MKIYELIIEGVAGPKKCWPGHRKVGTQPGTGKNKGKRVNDCEKIGEDAVAEGSGSSASATPAKNERGRFTALDDDEPIRLKCEDGEFRTIQEINVLRQKIGMKPFSIKRQQGVAEGWKDEADDFSEWTDYVKEKLSKASPEQRLGLAKKLSQVEVKNFGSSLSGGFDRNTGKAKTGELTDTVKSIMRSVGKGADGSAGNFSMPFGSVDVSGLEDAPPEVLKVMKKAVMLGGDVAAAARNFYKKHGTLTDQDLPKIQQGLASAASDDWKKQGRTTEGSGSEHMDKMMNDYKDKLPAAQAVDAKGRTQQRWIQLVKAKFPDAKIMVAKMKDGPVQATLSDGRKLSWKKVEQGTAEGNGDTEIRPGMQVSQGTVVKVNGNTVTVKASNGDMMTMNIHDVDQGVAEGAEDLTPNMAKYVLDQIYNSNGDVTMTDLFDEGIPGLRDMFMATAEELGLDPDEDFQDVESEVLEKLEDFVKGGHGVEEGKDELRRIIELSGAGAALSEEFDLIESIIDRLAEHNGVDAEVIWEDLESLTEDELYAFAVTSEPVMEDWQKANKRDKTDGMSKKAVNAYRRENPGSKLKTAVTTKPSKLKKGSKASKRRSSYCSRSKGQMKMHSISCSKTPDKAICKARRRWNC